ATGPDREPGGASYGHSLGDRSLQPPLCGLRTFDNRAVIIHLHTIHRHDGMELRGDLDRSAARRKINLAAWRAPVHLELKERPVRNEGPAIADRVEPPFPGQLRSKIRVYAACPYHRGAVKTQNRILAGRRRH